MAVILDELKYAFIITNTREVANIKKYTKIQLQL